MVKPAHWLAIGLTSAVLLMTGCSSSSTTPTADSSQPAATTPDTAPEAVAEAEAPDPTAPSDATAKPSSRVVEGVTLPAGTDPLAIVVAARQPNAETAGTELIKLAYPTPNKAVVVITKTGLPDDSVAATRTRYDFKPVEGTSGAEKQWQLAQVTEQNKCQKDRGPQDWTSELCQ